MRPKQEMMLINLILNASMLSMQSKYNENATKI